MPFELRPEPHATLRPEGDYLQRAWSESVYPIARSMGVPISLPPVSPHDLRHTAIALAIQSGAPITEVCEFARHARPDVTLRSYAGLAKDGRGGAMRRMLEAGYGV